MKYGRLLIKNFFIMSNEKKDLTTHDDEQNVNPINTQSETTDETAEAKDEDCGCDIVTEEQARVMAAKFATIDDRMDLDEGAEGAIDTPAQLRDAIAAELTQEELVIVAVRFILDARQEMQSNPLVALARALGGK